ncbi:hypothetical protein [Phytoactinopolyspora endophytica]|uniref:Rv1678 family membrane protein n=1 Tax=Phytoactinopolyspora endophytica TaxID=1642495 RepID=UPI00101CF2D0|nr:hypothetical protein [Phytoactinopolyspora endophytica]
MTPRVPTAPDPIDRACVVLGAASILSVVFVAEALDEFRFIRIGGASVAIAVGVGLLACLAGWLRRRGLAVVAGLAFLATAVVQVVSTATGNDWLSSNMSTASFWLGLGAGLVAVGSTPRASNEPHPEGSR